MTRKDGGRNLDEPSNDHSYLSIFTTHFFGTPAENQVILRKLYVDFDLSSQQISQITGWPRTTISEFLKRSKLTKAQLKPPTPRYGERIIGGVRVPHQAELRVIEKMISLRKNGQSFRAIAQTLNAQGVPTKKGLQWSKTTVQSIVNRHQEEQK